jgi:MarR family transcriptional regulator, lower aerobic nicotinate degradation pathway regulator
MVTMKPATGTRESAQGADVAGHTMLIFRLARVSGYRLTQALAALEMRTNEFAVLHHLHEAGPLSQQELGGALRINPSNLVGLLDALEADGLVVRPRDPADRRRHLVGLTTAGHERLVQAKRAVARAEQDLLSPLSASERGLLYGFLERLAGHSCSPRRC